MLKLVESTGIGIPELSVSLVTARGEVVNESDPMTEELEASTPLPTKKGKSLRTKISNKSSSKTPVLKEVSPAGPSTLTVAQPAAFAGTQSPPGWIETYNPDRKFCLE